MLKFSSNSPRPIVNKSRRICALAKYLQNDSQWSV